jgi:prophage tail gpP-like protein
VPRVTTVFGGKRLEGWTSITVKSSLDEGADSFEVGITSKLAGSRDALLVADGMPAVVEVDGQPMITGWINGMRRSTIATSRSITVAGRSSAGDLIDCSVTTRTTWRKRPASEIATQLCAPYGIPAAIEVPADDPLPSFRTQTGEKVFDALKRLGSELGGRWISRRDGGIRLIRSIGTKRARAVIARGYNVVASSLTERSDERFSSYYFRSQLATSDGLNGDDAANLERRVDDAGVARHRPLLLQADGQGGAKALQRMAEWERTTRAGSSVSASYTIIDPADAFRTWESSAGVLWAPGILVDVDDDLEGATGTWAVRTVSLHRRGDRIAADLELCHPDALTLEPPKPRKAGEALW